MKTKAFIRRVGFGLKPDEKVPTNPLDWAKEQMLVVPKLIWQLMLLMMMEKRRKRILEKHFGRACFLEKVTSWPIVEKTILNLIKL